MAWLALGFCLLALLFLLGRLFVTVPAGTLARGLRTFVAIFMALAGSGLLVLGRFGLALIAIAAAALTIRSLLASYSPPGSLGDQEDEAAAEVQTSYLHLRLDKGTGAVEGQVLAGRHAGRGLAFLGLTELLDLLEELRREDPKGATLLEAYLDRRAPEWREDAARADGGPQRDAGGTEVLDERTALEILGLEAGAAPEEIKAAHRRLMERLHPDRGGSTWIASRINAAKDLLLRARG
jgi:membrane protein implicated in regulation of membrane protease activity